MAAIHRRANGYFMLSYMENGRRRRVSLGTKDLAQAKQFLDEFEASQQNQYLPRSGHHIMSTEEAVAFFLHHQRKVQRTTLSWYTGRLALWEDFIGRERPMSSVTPEEVCEFKNHRLDNVAPNTVRGNLRAVKALYNYLIHVRLIPLRNPVTRDAMRVSGGAVTSGIVLDSDERLLYETALNGDMFYVYMFGVYAGLRRGELCYLERSDIRNGIIHITNKPHLNYEIKDHQARDIPVDGKLVSAITSLPMEGPAFRTPKGLPWTPARLGSEWTETVENLRLPPHRVQKNHEIHGARLHDLRRTYASIQVIEKGTDVYTLARRLGHSEITTTQRYLFAFERV